MVKFISIIIARGGSKGIPNKNIIDFCGKPLIAWTIDACLKGGVTSVWVSSDSEQILEISKVYGANVIKRPKEFAKDTSSSEDAWNHAIDYLKIKMKITPDWVIAPQVTSPLTEAKDISSAILKANYQNFDSYFSCCKVSDMLIWETNKSEKLSSLNYNWKDRKRRQDSNKQYIENGAFYLFKPEVLKEKNNRFGNNIGFIEMDSWKIFEIDEYDDIKICKTLMQYMIIKN
tara:strand:- start:17068 stop:17760 length:693 start_codon:yes stop_codon:yes gene_type:complete